MDVSEAIRLPDLKRVLRQEVRKMQRKRAGSGTTGTLIAYEALNWQVSVALCHLMDRESSAARRLSG